MRHWFVIHAFTGLLLANCGRAISQSPEWSGNGSFRLLVEVAPAAIGARPFDERPAQLAINFQAALVSGFGINGIPDLRSVQVIRYNPSTGAPNGEGSWAYGMTSADRAFRWYDDTIPAAYPEVESYLSDNSTGSQTRTNRQNWGYFFDVEGDWESGRLAWSHIQEGNAPSRYAIYFDVLPTGTVPHLASPRGFLGDGGMRTQKIGPTTTGAIETRIDVTDWNGDGRFDIVAGNLRGGVSVYHNLGTSSMPDFGSSKLLFTTDGKPIDVGWNATPKIVDFDADGDDDIVTGGQHNRIAWYKNVGTNADRQFQYMGNIRNSSGQVLALPTTPNPERPTITADYYPVIDMVDFNNDGARDLIAGGYITGRLYYYKNVGRNTDGTPQLQLQGPIEANGAPIDTEWGAAPEFADFTGDGLLDIVTGTFAINSGVTSAKFLDYYVNVGTAAAPAFEKRTFPRVGQFPVAALASPRAVDYDNDGRLDLAVSTDEQIYLYRNTGTTSAPRWTAGAAPLAGEWVSAPLFASQFVDWNNDGHLDKIQNLNVSLNLKQGNPGLYGPAFSVLPAGQSVPPKPGGGDGWQWLRLFDLDWDGELDILDADHDGKIWLHRNNGTTSSPNFDTVGVPFMQLNGQPIDVGPGPSDPLFDQLQGSRATYSVTDFNNNGRPDLVVVNFAGAVRYYENEMASQSDNPLFTMPALVGQLPTRGVPFSADWDGDGDFDILASSDPARMLFIENTGNDVGGRAIFAGGVWVGLIDAPYGSIGLNITDFNGDGDGDIMVDTTHRYSVLTDGSFLQLGYANGMLVAIERIAVLAGDYNRNGVVDVADYVLWRDTLGQAVENGSRADGDRDGTVDQDDYAVWRAHFAERSAMAAGISSSVPEPNSLLLLLYAANLLTAIVVNRPRTSALF
jgi:FG-GAP-like repeat